MLSPSGLPGWWIGTKARDFYGALQTKKVLQKKNCPRLRESRAGVHKRDSRKLYRAFWHVFGHLSTVLRTVESGYSDTL